MSDKPRRPLPHPTPETQHFWEGCRTGELRLQRCDDCDHVYFPPRPFCPRCSSRAVSIFVASGAATLASYVINQRPHPAWDEAYAIAIVELAEGPRMATNITHCDQTPEALVLDMPLQVDFTRITDEITLPLFRPTDGAAA
ncbi:MAG: zinc ribbon domain-containing protein [Pseudomonadota bacterium]